MRIKVLLLMPVLFLILVSCASMEVLDSLAVAVQEKTDGYNQKIQGVREDLQEQRIREYEAQRRIEERKKSSSNDIQASSKSEVVEPEDDLEKFVKRFVSGCESWCIPCNKTNGFPGINHNNSSTACF